MNVTMTPPACSDISLDMRYPEHTTVLRLVFIVVHLLIFVLSIVGNGAILYVTVTTRALQTIQNWLIANLALANICVSLLALPIGIVASLYKTWYFGGVLCKVLPWVQAMSIFVTSLSLCVIAVDRYTLIIYPHSRLFTRHNISFFICVIWLVSMLLPLPYALNMTLMPFPETCGLFCMENWEGNYKMSFSIGTLIAQFFIPFIIQFYCYSLIFVHLRRRARRRMAQLETTKRRLDTSMAGLGTDSDITADRPSSINTEALQAASRRSDIVRKQRRRTTLVLVSMVSIFACSQLPFNVYNITYDMYSAEMEYFYGHVWKGKQVGYLVMILAQSCAYMNTIANPVLYAFLNPQFSAVLARTLRFDRKFAAYESTRKNSRMAKRSTATGDTEVGTLMGRRSTGVPPLIANGSPRSRALSTPTQFRKHNHNNNSALTTDAEPNSTRTTDADPPTATVTPTTCLTPTPTVVVDSIIVSDL